MPVYAVGFFKALHTIAAGNKVVGIGLANKYDIPSFEITR